MTNTTNKRRTNFFQPISQKVLLFLLTLCFIVASTLKTFSQTTFQKTYGGSGAESGVNIINTEDGGYAIIGNAGSFGAGNLDMYVIKTTADGTMQWSKTYGGRNEGQKPFFYN